MNLTRKMGILFLIVCLSSVTLSSLFADHQKATQVLVTNGEGRVDDAFLYEKDGKTYTYVFHGSRTHYEIDDYCHYAAWGDILYYTVYYMDEDNTIHETVKQTKIIDHGVASSAVLIPGKDGKSDMVCVMYVDYDDHKGSTHTIYYKLGEINPDFSIDFGPQTKVSSKFDYKQLTAAYSDELARVILIANDDASSYSDNYEMFYLLGGQIKVNEDTTTIDWSMSDNGQRWDRGHQMRLIIRGKRVIFTHTGATSNRLYVSDGFPYVYDDGTIGIHWYHPNQQIFPNDASDDCLDVALIPPDLTSDPYNVGVTGIYHDKTDRSKIYKLDGTIPSSPEVTPSISKGNVIAYGNITYRTKNAIFVNHKLLISQTPDADGRYLVVLVCENASDDREYFCDGPIKLAYGYLKYDRDKSEASIDWISNIEFDDENSACKPI